MEKSQEKYLNLISAEVIADSLNQFGERITTMKLVFPRIILAEFNTHRMFNRNSASSRAIPFKKMVKIVEEQPFIPIAWQKDHKGMQGTEYITEQSVVDFKKGVWLNARNKAIQSAEELYYPVSKAKSIYDIEELKGTGVTKQLANRLLEPFMWNTVLITSSKEGLDNFFNLRCPSYEWEYEEGVIKAKSKEEFLEMFIKRYPTNGERELHDMELVDEHLNPNNSINWFNLNKGQAEIHIMDLAEKMWDAMNESTPKQLEVGQWHIPFGDNIKEHLLLESFGFLTPTEIEEIKVKIAVARCARLSYETLGDNPVIDYRKDIALHNTLLAVKHMSPFEHCAVVMENEEYYSHIKGNIKTQIVNVFEERRTTPIDKDSNVFGWSRNLKGFKQYREIIEYGK